MGISRLRFSAVVAAALLVTVAGTSAAPTQWRGGQWQYGDAQQQQFFTALSSVNLSSDQRTTIRGIVNDGFRNGASDREIDDRIVGTLNDAQRADLERRLGWGATAPSLPAGYNVVAVVANISRGAITLQNGHTVFLRDSTQFTPDRGSVWAGTTIAIAGNFIADGNMNADRIEVLGTGWQAGRGGSYFGVVSAVSRGDITLQSGRTVFLHDGTAYQPSRDAIQPGVQISVRGNLIADGNVNADEVDVVTYSSTGLGPPNSGWYDGYQNGSYLGVILSASRGALGLRNGHTAFLRDGTTINPRGFNLVPGTRVAIRGSLTQDGNINADRVDVIDAGQWDIFNGGSVRRLL